MEKNKDNGMNSQTIMGQKCLCPVCGGQNQINWLICDDGQELVSCKDCGLGYLSPYPTQIDDLYQDYGDHITKLPAKYFESRLRISLTKSLFFFILKKILGSDLQLLDYGGGAGFFIRAAQKCGIKNSYLFEPSENFRRSAIEKVGIDETHVTDDLGEMDVKFSFVSMLDVIEHLPQEKIHVLLGQLARQMKPGGYLFGETPNKVSVNLRVFGKKDPAICPPSHLLYFTSDSLDSLLQAHGFEKKILFSMGLSTNSFFRKNRFEPSKIEQPETAMQKFFSVSVKLLFKFFGLFTFLTGSGYQLVFLYRLKDSKQFDS